MKLYTRTGDAGTTAIWGGQRVPKSDLRIQTLGDIDTTSAAIGLALTADGSSTLRDDLRHALDLLYRAGVEVMATGTPGPRPHIQPIDAEDVTALEARIDELDHQLPQLRNFIHPTGSTAAASLHLARAQCRAAERSAHGLEALTSTHVPTYLNRLSDYLFNAARTCNMLQQIPETYAR